MYGTGYEQIEEDLWSALWEYDDSWYGKMKVKPQTVWALDTKKQTENINMIVQISRFGWQRIVFWFVAPWHDVPMYWCTLLMH